MKHVFILSLILILNSSCQENDKKTTLSWNELYEQFSQKGRIHKFENSALMFGPEKIDYTDLFSGLQMDTTRLSEEKSSVYRKGTFKLADENDSTTVFKYAIAKDRKIQELRFRTFRAGNFIEDKTIIKFNNSNIDYDYYVLDDLIYVIGTNNKKEKHYTFYRIFRGNINQISFTPDTLFQKEKPFNVDQFSDKDVVIYNNFQTKELEIDETTKGRLTGKVIRGYGRKEGGFYEVVKLNSNNIFDKNVIYIAFSDNKMHFPKSLLYLTQDELDETDYNKIDVPQPFITDIFVEIIK